MAARAAAAKLRGPADSWEDRPLQERCLLYHGTPPFPTGYNNNYQIAQTRDYVAIRYEMLAETRIIPLDGRPHLGPNIRQWMGNSRGHWEGDTLVVETTNYSDKTTFRFPASENLKVVERFTRTDADNIDYRFTVHDPTMYTKPWTRGSAAGQGRRAHLRIRVPRGELRDDQPSQRAPLRGKGRRRIGWEGDTLIVDTTHFNREARVSYDTPATRSLHVVERFTRVDADTLMYEFTSKIRRHGPGRGPARSNEEDDRPDLRIRLPRRQPSDAEHALWRAG